MIVIALAAEGSAYGLLLERCNGMQRTLWFLRFFTLAKPKIIIF